MMGGESRSLDDSASPAGSSGGSTPRSSGGSSASGGRGSGSGAGAGAGSGSGGAGAGSATGLGLMGSVGGAPARKASCSPSEALGDTSTALASLERSLTLAEPEGYVRMYLNEGAPMATLMRKAASHNICLDYVDQLLTALEIEIARPSVPSPLCSSPLLEPLTPRERDVLHLISQGLSNQQIAEELVIALNTVKRHTSGIYGKLGVKSRTQAVAQAHQLGLFSTDQE